MGSVAYPDKGHSISPGKIRCLFTGLLRHSQSTEYSGLDNRVQGMYHDNFPFPSQSGNDSPIQAALPMKTLLQQLNLSVNDGGC